MPSDPFVEAFKDDEARGHRYLDYGTQDADYGYARPQAWSYRRRSSEYSVNDSERDIVDIERGAGKALYYGQIGNSEYNAIQDIADDSDRRSFVERMLRYRDHQSGALGRLGDVVAIADTVGGNRFIVSASKAAAIAAKDQTGWRPFANLGIVGDTLPAGGKSWLLNAAWSVGDFIQNFSVGFSTDEFRRAAAERTSYMDVLAIGGSDGWIAKGVGASFDVVLDPLTWISLGTSAAGKVALKPGAAEVIAKSIGRNADDVARTMTMNPWGRRILERAAEDVYEEAGEELVKKITKTYRTGESHIDAYLTASQREVHNQILDYAIRNYDRIANDLVTDYAKASGWKITRRLHEAAEVAAGPAAMFKETHNAAMIAKHGKGYGKLVSVHDVSFLRGALGGVVGGAAGDAMVGLIGADGFDVAGAMAGFVIAGSPKAREIASKVGKLTPMWGKFSESVVGSTSNFIKETFHSAIKELPDDIRTAFDQVEREGTSVATEMRSTIRDFVQKNGYGKEDFVAVARHLDDPKEYGLEDRLTPLADFAKKTLDDVHAREQEFGIGTKYRENYVTHLYGTNLNRSVIQWMRESISGAPKRVSVPREFIESKNRFRLAREIATFDDADRVFGKGVVVDDIAEILARRVAMSEKMIAKARMMDLSIERYGIDAMAANFKSHYNAMNKLAEKMGNVAIDFTEMPVGPQYKVSDASIDGLARALGASDAVRKIHSKGPFFSADAANNRGLLDTFARRAYNRPLSELTQAQFDQVDEFLRGHFIDNLSGKLDFSGAELQLVEYRVGSNLPRRMHLVGANADRRVAFIAAGLDVSDAAQVAADVAPLDATDAVMKRINKLRRGAAAERTRIGEERMRWLTDGDPQIVKAGVAARKRVADAIRRGSKNSDKIIEESGPAIRRAERYMEVVNDEALKAKVKRITDAEAEALRLENLPADSLVRPGGTADVVAPLSSGYANAIDGIRKALSSLGGKIGYVRAAHGKEKFSLVDSLPSIAKHRSVADRELTKMAKSFERYEQKLRDELAKHPLMAGLQYKDLYDLEELLDKRFMESGIEGYREARSQVLSTIQEYTNARTAYESGREGIETLIKDLDGKIKIAAEALADPKFVEDMEKIEGFAAESARKKKMIDKLQAEAESIRNREILSKDELGGTYYLPKPIIDAIEELDGRVYDDGLVSKALLAMKKSNNVFKAPLLLFFKDYWFRNAVSNTINLATWAGIKLAQPSNVFDSAAVAGSLMARKGTWYGPRKWRDAALAREIKTPHGTFTAKQIADEIVKRGINATYTSSESQFLSELHGPLRGIGGNKALFKSARDPVRTMKRVKEEGVIRAGGETLAIASDVMSNLQYPTEVLHRVALFTMAVKDTGSFVRAAETVADYLGNFGRMSRAEQKYLTSIMPFYSWTRFAIGRALENFDKNPKILQAQAKAINGLQRQFGSDSAAYNTEAVGQPWIEASIGITSDGPNGLKKKLMIYGLLEDEAMRIAYDSGLFVRNMLHFGAKAIGAESAAYSPMLRPELSGKDTFKLLANMAFVPRALLEFVRQREFYGGAAIGGDPMEADESFSRLKNAKHLVEGTIGDETIPSAYTPFNIPDNAALRGADRFGQSILRFLSQADNEGEGQAFTRWLLGSALPTSRFVNTLERRLKVRMEYKRAGQEVKYNEEVNDAVLTALGARAYLYDPNKQQLYLNRARIDAMKKILIDADAMEFKKITFFTDPNERRRRQSQRR